MPAMVALITEIITADPVSLHFTYLKPDGSGKAPIERPRLYLAGHHKAGGVVRMHPDEDVTQGLLIGEGLETVLSAAQVFLPAWAALDASNLKTFPCSLGLKP
jgi:hypothetical protein